MGFDQDSVLYTGWGKMLPQFVGSGVAVYNNAAPLAPRSPSACQT